MAVEVVSEGVEVVTEEVDLEEGEVDLEEEEVDLAGEVVVAEVEEEDLVIVDEGVVEVDLEEEEVHVAEVVSKFILLWQLQSIFFKFHLLSYVEPISYMLLWRLQMAQS